VTAILSGQRLNLEPEGLSRQQRRHEIQGRADSTVFNALVKPLAEPSNNRHSNGNGHSNGHNGNGHKGTAQQSAIELVPMWPAADAMGLGEEAL